MKSLIFTVNGEQYLNDLDKMKEVAKGLARIIVVGILKVALVRCMGGWLK